MIFLKFDMVRSRAGIESVGPRFRHQLYQIVITFFVLCQHHEVVTAAVALGFFFVCQPPAVAHYIHFAAEDGFEGFLSGIFPLAVHALAVVEKLLYAHHVAVVGDGHAAHAVAHGLVDQLRYTGLSVEYRVVCMYVQVYEIFHVLCPPVLIWRRKVTQKP